MKIKSLVLETKDIKRLANFYETILELDVVRSGTEFTVNLNASAIRFKLSVSGDPFYHFAIAIPCNKIEEARKWMAEKLELIWIEEYKNVIADFVNWKARSIYFFDAAGNIVELIARFDLHNETEEKFSSKHFLSVSEIGLVFPEHEIEIKTQELLKQYALSYFDKQQPFPNFKAVGDDEGLLIIVTDNRNWYPTTKPSGIFSLELEMEQKGKTYPMAFG
jgi:catechol-2,3-dioxygenase